MICVLDYTENPISHMGRMSSICYDSSPTYPVFTGMDCIKSGHHRVMEFADVTLEISEYSARVIRELYTHIVGVTRLQESTRYVEYDSFNMYIPDSVMKNKDALLEYHMAKSELQYRMRQLKKMGIPKEDIANLLPLGSHTKIVIKINCRALYNMAQVRMCTRAYREYRQMFHEIIESLQFLDQEWNVFTEFLQPKCEHLGYCNEKKSCGRKAKLDDLKRHSETLL